MNLTCGSIVINPEKERFIRSKLFALPSEIIGVFPYSDYLDPNCRDSFIKKRLIDKLFLPDMICYSLLSKGVVSSCVFVSESTWDSSHFAGHFYNLEIYSDGQKTNGELVDLLLFAVEKASVGKNGGSHFTCKTGRGCESLVNALMAAGFSSTGRQTVLAAFKGDLLGLDRRRECMYGSRIVDCQEISADDLKFLGSNINFPSRLYEDPIYEHSKIREMNAEWIESIAKMPPNDRTALIYQKNGRSVGVAASKLVWSHAGVRVFGSAMFGFLPDEGLYIYNRLLSFGISESLKKASAIEFTVSEKNKVFLKTLQRSGYRRVRGIETFTLTY